MNRDVFPPRDLPGRSEEWGRQVERRIEGGEASEEQLEQKVDNGLRATGGQLAVLSRQIEMLSEAQQDLLGRESYASFWGNDSITVSSNVSGVELSPLSVEFQLRERRVVSIRTTVDVAASRGTGSASAFCAIRHTINGLDLNVDQTTGGFARGVVVNEPMLSQTVATTLIELDPGGYTMTPKYSTNVTPNGYVVLQAGSTVVDVLQRA